MAAPQADSSAVGMVYPHGNPHLVTGYKDGIPPRSAYHLHDMIVEHDYLLCKSDLKPFKYDESLATSALEGTELEVLVKFRSFACDVAAADGHILVSQISNAEKRVYAHTLVFTRNLSLHGRCPLAILCHHAADYPISDALKAARKFAASFTQPLKEIYVSNAAGVNGAFKPLSTCTMPAELERLVWHKRSDIAVKPILTHYTKSRLRTIFMAACAVGQAEHTKLLEVVILSDGATAEPEDAKQVMEAVARWRKAQEAQVATTIVVISDQRVELACLPTREFRVHGRLNVNVERCLATLLASAGRDVTLVLSGTMEQNTDDVRGSDNPTLLRQLTIPANVTRLTCPRSAPLLHALLPAIRRHRQLKQLNLPPCLDAGCTDVNVDHTTCVSAALSHFAESEDKCVESLFLQCQSRQQLELLMKIINSEKGLDSLTLYGGSKISEDHLRSSLAQPCWEKNVHLQFQELEEDVVV